jgi:hypothetical protein
MVYLKRENPSDRYVSTHAIGTGNTTIESVELDYTYDYNKYEWLAAPYIALQASQFFRVGRHQFNMGGLYYESDRDYRNLEVTDTDFHLSGTSILVFEDDTTQTQTSLRTRKQMSFYLQDIWNPIDSLTLEAALYVDRLDNVNSLEDLTWEETYYNPRFGLIFRPTVNDTFKLSWAKYTEPFDRVERIDAIEAAGHPFSNFYEGSVFRDVILSYNHEWPTGMFIIIISKKEPTLDYLTYENGVPVEWQVNNKYHLVETSVNQLLFSDIGFSAGHSFFDVRQDTVTPWYESDNHRIWARLTKAHESGLSASVRAAYFHVDYDTDTRQDTSYWTASSYIEYELPKKRGKIRLEIENIFDERFDSSPLGELTSLLPYRTYGLLVELNF